MDLTPSTFAATPEVLQATAHLRQKLKNTVTDVKWMTYAPIIAEINKLKKERNAVILAHNYQTPEIFNCVADIVGDSLQLAVEASKVKEDIIVQCGVYFMAETSKILNPNKTVLIPDLEAGCSLADSITGADVRLLREKFPGVPIVTYVNTTADVKAESDICCTSSNAVAICEEMARLAGTDRVLCIPDEYLAKYVQTKTDKIKVLTWHGHCEVHEKFTATEIRHYREKNPGVIVLAHPECPPDVIKEADFTGSTSAMIRYVGEKRPAKVVMITECSMSDNVSIQYPDVEFVRPCNLCPHMKRITLPKILDCLRELKHEVIVDPAVSGKAREAVEKMIAMSQKLKI
jgi:quinolinate synthase